MASVFLDLVRSVHMVFSMVIIPLTKTILKIISKLNLLCKKNEVCTVYARYFCTSFLLYFDFKIV